jgi:hypothetical protein
VMTVVVAGESLDFCGRKVAVVTSISMSSGSSLNFDAGDSAVAPTAEVEDRAIATTTHQKDFPEFMRLPSSSLLE